MEKQNFLFIIYSLNVYRAKIPVYINFAINDSQCL